jgi:arylsulfatase
MLKEQGYVTGAFGKWGLGAQDSSGDPLRLGFDRFFGCNCQRHAHNLYPKYLVSDNGKVMLEGNTRGLTGEKYGPQMIADEMLKFIRTNKDKPFFVYYPTVLPHLSLQAPQEFIDMYKGKWPEKPYKGKSYLPHPTPRSCYAAMISFMDHQVGRLMDTLKELNLDDNTIVFFTSDNGTTYLKGQVDYEFFDSVGPLRGLKGSLYEGGIREPMVVRWPGHIKAGTVTDLISANYDAMATFADLAGCPVPAETDGISFLPTLLSESKQQKKHKYLFWDFAGYGGQLAVRMGRWKGIKRNLKKNPDAPLELYDIHKDIAEKHNVADQYPEIAKEIEQIMITARTCPETKSFRFGKYAK